MRRRSSGWPASSTPSINGRDLNPLVDGERPPWRTRNSSTSTVFSHPKIPKSEGVRTENWAYFQFLSSNRCTKMYDLAHDPQEDHNLVKDPEYSDRLRPSSRTTEGLDRELGSVEH
ncbi:MAG: DUF4976 domain-containing protein [Bryobacterales bacterium]